MGQTFKNTKHHNGLGADTDISRLSLKAPVFIVQTNFTPKYIKLCSCGKYIYSTVRYFYFYSTTSERETLFTTLPDGYIH